MPFTLAYVIIRFVLSLVAVLCRGEVSKDVELLVLRHENAVLCRQVPRPRYESADRIWFAALSRLVPRRRWPAMFPMTPATILRWHRRLVARKWTYTDRRRPGRPPTNAHCERIIGTLRREVLDRMLILNEQHLRRTLTRYLQHYNTAPPHRGIGQLSPSQAETGPPTPIGLANHRIHRRAILGGLINEYQIAS